MRPRQIGQLRRGDRRREGHTRTRAAMLTPSLRGEDETANYVSRVEKDEGGGTDDRAIGHAHCPSGERQRMIWLDMGSVSAVAAATTRTMNFDVWCNSPLRNGQRDGFSWHRRCRLPKSVESAQKRLLFRFASFSR